MQASANGWPGIAELKPIIASSPYLAAHEFYLYGLQRQSGHFLGILAGCAGADCGGYSAVCGECVNSAAGVPFYREVW
ncbi:hypothetical protein [Paenibacillus sp. S150]|uniref:hypothetical protein n=1 Tax=Paenibacillus sp. S150 TaxID=2749826 RepID=UPI001C58F96D|nr:hypothetical protein [Paenibacillus sp. S150]MBW4084853.1 hypothetical protein [Paenibacillus sp. S150]